MSEDKKGTRTRRERITQEVMEYGVNFIYLACFFGVFTWYQRLVLASYQIVYLDYGVSLIKAAVLAKVVMIGQALGLGRRFEDGPLILPVLFKTVVFTLWVGLFHVLEQTVRGLLKGEGPAGGLHHFMAGGGDEFLARCLVTFFAFVPFFAVKELGRVFGEGRMGQLFFGRKAPEQSGQADDAEP